MTETATVHAPVDPQVLRAELLHIIGEAIEDHPRSKQVAPGPSEVGTPCERRLAYKLLNTPPATIRPPGWRPTVGTAVHAWLEDVFEAWNINRGHIEKGTGRWIVEHRQAVGQYLGEDLEGSTDLFDTATLTSVDWKVPGPSTMKKARAAAARGEFHDPAYRTQGHLYGRGWELRGYPVQMVAIMFMPAAGELTDAVIQAEPYNPQIAADAMARLERIKTVTNGLGPLAPAILPATEAHCEHCDWFRPGAVDLQVACPGAATLKPRGSAVRSLIA